MGLRLCTAALAAAFLCGVSALADDQCPPLKIVASVDVVPMKSGLVMVPVEVAGQQRYFVVGTANPVSSISAALAQELKLPRGHSSIKFVGLSGQVNNTWASVPVFGIGNLRAESVDMLVVGADHPIPAPPPGVKAPSGTLGADFLRAYDVDLDFGANKLNLISRDHCSGNVLYWNPDHVAKLTMTVLDNGKIYFPMHLDGHTLEAVLNTGVAMSNIKMSRAGELYDIDNNSPGNTNVGALPDGTPLFAHSFKNMDIEGLTVGNPKLVLMPSLAEEKIRHMKAINGPRAMMRLPNAGEEQPELVLGMAELRQLHVYIAYRDQNVYFSPVTPGGDSPKKSAANAP